MSNPNARTWKRCTTLMAARQRSRDDARDLPAAIYPSVPFSWRCVYHVYGLETSFFFSYLFIYFFLFLLLLQTVIIRFVIVGGIFVFTYDFLFYRLTCTIRKRKRNDNPSSIDDLSTSYFFFQAEKRIDKNWSRSNILSNLSPSVKWTVGRRFEE